ncbi:MAG: hypothetical protein IPH78_09755 [Bacteroidetes bacterium]|nr:hypothetical protein [Bacteroidota bacterium]
MSFRFKYRLWGFVPILLLHYSVNAQPSFAKVWDRTYTGGQLYSAKPTYDGGYIMCGVSYVGIAGDKTEPLIGHSDIWVVKADSLGNKEWDRTIGGNFVDGFSKVFPARDSSGFLLCIASSSNLSGNKTENSIGLLQSVDYWIVKLDNHGVVVWDKTIGAYDIDYPVGIEQTPDGGLVILGESNSDNTGHKTDTVRGKDFDLWVVKLDSSRNILWDKTIGGMDVEYARCITTDKHGNIIAGGVTASDSGIDVSQARKGIIDYFLVKIDANGETIWNKRYGGEFYNELSAITATHDGGFALLGYSTSGIGGDKTTPKIDTVLYYDDYWLVKVDSNGEKQWDRSYGGIGLDRTNFGAIFQTTDRGFYLVAIRIHKQVVINRKTT